MGDTAMGDMYDTTMGDMGDVWWGDMGDMGETTMGDMGETTMGDATMPPGMCMNAEDGAILASMDVADATSTAATDCYLGGATEDEAYVTCTSEALIDETGLTAGCVDCFVQSALCAKNNCLVECLSDPVACETCREENGCTSSFYECSGLAVPE
jgi:hypothetical protein